VEGWIKAVCILLIWAAFVFTATGATTLCVLCIECSELVVCREGSNVDIVDVCEAAVLASRVGEVAIMVDVEEP
jgi:hypothetical protein